MQRRGFFGRAVAAMALPRALASKQAFPAVDGGSIAKDSLEAVLSPVSHGNPDKNWALLDAVSKDHRSRDRRARLSLLMHGGMDPRVFPCNSWAPWFKAQVSARMLNERDERNDGIMRQLRIKVFGNDPFDI